MNLPFLQATALQDGATIYSSKTTGLTIVDPDPSNLNALLTITAPAFDGHEASEVELPRGRDVEAFYADYWLRRVCVEIGLGFHVDTSADDYEPALPADLAEEYDAMIAYCFEHIENPYGVAYGAMANAGLFNDNFRM